MQHEIDLVWFDLSFVACSTPMPLQQIKFPQNTKQLFVLYRRSIWNLLRVEWENLKQQKAHEDFDGSDRSEDDDHAPFLPQIPPMPTSNSTSTAKRITSATM